LANYGKNERPEDVVPDWLLGGNRKRRILWALTKEGPGATIRDLVDTLGCGTTTAFETVRALRALGVIDQDSEHRVRLDEGHQLTAAIRAMLSALEPFEDQLVDRPPRARGRT
jgi:DNA-binding IclR family transcriptional regulator